MKVAAFLGSPRKNGNTARLLKEFLKEHLIYISGSCF